MKNRDMWTLGAVLFLSACGGSPTAPPPADSGDGITIYADPRFRGLSSVLVTDVEDLDDLEAGEGSCHALKLGPGPCQAPNSLRFWASNSDGVSVPRCNMPSSFSSCEATSPVSEPPAA